MLFPLPKKDIECVELSEIEPIAANTIWPYSKTTHCDVIFIVLLSPTTGDVLVSPFDSNTMFAKAGT